jgi:hypothetical protein
LYIKCLVESWFEKILLTNLLIQKNCINGHIFFMTKFNIRVNWNNNLMNVHILVVCKNVINVEKTMRSILNNVKSNILINNVLCNFKMFSHILHNCGKFIMKQHKRLSFIKWAMDDVIVQQCIILICKILKHLYNSNKRTSRYYI